MSFALVSKDEGIATVTLSRGKVNALNEAVVEELDARLQEFERAGDVRGIILTGQGKFFSFGFDIPEFLSQPKESFAGYLKRFTTLYRYMFLYPKPLVAALNGHTIAGGCMLATACDYRLMVAGKARISLNEITFGSSVFAGSVELLRYWTGDKNAQTVLFSGAMYSAEEALKLGLVDQVSTEANLLSEAKQVAQQLASKDGSPFGSIKRLLRKPVGEEMARREGDSIAEFVDIWYSETTWKKVQGIKIHG
jgi:enoyl-CoA hydratase/carnithine racemase